MTEEAIYDAKCLDGLWVFDSYSEPARDQVVNVRHSNGTVSKAQVTRTLHYRQGIFTVMFRPL